MKSYYSCPVEDPSQGRTGWTDEQQTDLAPRRHCVQAPEGTLIYFASAGTCRGQASLHLHCSLVCHERFMPRMHEG